jgi:hypothetical protein
VSSMALAAQGASSAVMDMALTSACGYGSGSSFDSSSSCDSSSSSSSCMHMQDNWCQERHSTH